MPSQPCASQSAHSRPCSPSAEGSEQSRTGALIVNADDWGQDRDTTDRTLDCVRCGSVSSVSAMMFMKDSERAAAIAREQRIDAGLHLNFTTPFSAPGIPGKLAGHQQRVSKYLLRYRLSQVLFHPGLIRSFEYVVSAQRNEFTRLYGREPDRLDGHHHMHLCANVLLGGLMPPGTVVRRNFSFQPGEKSIGNRFYRHVVDRALARRHRLTDLFFSLQPLAPSGRLERIFARARRFVVEVETHPLNPAEYCFLTEGRIFGLAGDCPIAPCFPACSNETRSVDSSSPQTGGRRKG
jgi:predicted glycoside hydrolase/deacetylase ChbG (UPF0249 family)